MIKEYKSKGYNYKFNTTNGFFMRWGDTYDEDPEYCKAGCEIADIEISTVCSQGCKFCYKTNTNKGINMSYENFKQVFKVLPKHLTQIAFGIGDIDANKDLWEIMSYCKVRNVIPNITINGSRMTDHYYDGLVHYCGAVAVSLYSYDVCYNAVQELSNRGMEQVNIHCLLAEETFDKCMQVLKDKQTDERLKGLNAIVFLWLKPKGDRNDLQQISTIKYRKLVKYAIDNKISIGFDSCSASNFSLILKEEYPSLYKSIEPHIESCESTLFSYYINADCMGFPCSFSEGIYKGVDLLRANEFKDVWYANETKDFRKKVLENKDCNGCRMCPIYDLRLKDEN